jgi:phosphopantetheinyl transferase
MEVSVKKLDLSEYYAEIAARMGGKLLAFRESIVEDRTDHWLEYVPDSYRPDTPVPLVISIHGGGQTDYAQFYETSWYRVAERTGAIIVYPEIPQSGPARFVDGPAPGSDFIFLDRLLELNKTVSALAQKEGWKTGENGKPFEHGVITGNLKLYVSLSHSGGLAAVAVSSEPVGVDVQRKPEIPVDRLLRIASKFHPDERARLEALHENQLPDAFCRLWACKESVLKLCGRGLSLPLSSFCIGEDDACQLEGNPVRLTVDKLPGAYLSTAEWE